MIVVLAYVVRTQLDGGTYIAVAMLPILKASVSQLEPDGRVLLTQKANPQCIVQRR